MMSIPETPIPEEEYEQLGDDTYVTDFLLDKYHTAEGARRFRNWAIQSTMQLIKGKSYYFPSDYEKWIELGLPENRSAD